MGVYIHDGQLTLSTELLDLPVVLAEFVIVHELVHLLAPHHDRLFRSFMHLYRPDWEERQRDAQALRNVLYKIWEVEGCEQCRPMLHGRVYLRKLYVGDFLTKISAKVGNGEHHEPDE